MRKDAKEEATAHLMRQKFYTKDKKGPTDPVGDLINNMDMLMSPESVEANTV